MTDVAGRGNFPNVSFRGSDVEPLGSAAEAAV